jgi:hypothetical protein
VSPASVAARRQRFAQDGVSKLGKMRSGRGRKPAMSQAKIDEIVDLTSSSTPEGQTQRTSSFGPSSPITLGYAGTVHSAQGLTVGSSQRYGICWTIGSDRASRAMAYVGMTRGRDENHLAIYRAATNEADHHHGANTRLHQMRRGTKHTAAYALHTILTANEHRARTMHTVAARTERELLPSVIAALLDRNDQRCADRAQAWRRHTAQTGAPRARLPTFDRDQTAGCSAPAEP